MTGSAGSLSTSRRRVLGWLAGSTAAALAGNAFSQPTRSLDHGYAAWDRLLKKHVRWLADGKQSRVDYRALALERAALAGVLTEWSAVPSSAFATFTREQQMAFLINAYNGFTLELVLGRYPQLQSIKDIGSLLQSPWRKKFFLLLGDQRSLDWIEHEQLRARYADWRLHAALNCASIGCPALRPEAFTAAALASQLEDGMRRFMADRSRNRYGNGRAEISAIFKWYREDFEKGDLGVRRLEDLLARYAEQLADAPAERGRLRSAPVAIGFLDYDWSLNDSGATKTGL